MKTIVACLVMLGSAAVASAGPCDNAVLMKQGAVMEITRFGPNHAPMGRIVSTIVSSFTDGDKVTAVELVDNYDVKGVKNNTSTIDLVCDGKTVRMNTRNDDAMKAWAQAAAEMGKTGQKLLNASLVTDPQIFPTEMKVGADLPPFRAFSTMLVQKAPPDFGMIAATGHWEKALEYAMHSKLSGGMAMVTKNGKIVAEETCTLPDGSKPKCFRITAQMYARPLRGDGDYKLDADALAKTAISTTNIQQWFVPGVGVAKMEIANSVANITMELTKLSIPTAPAAAPPPLTAPPQ